MSKLNLSSRQDIVKNNDTFMYFIYLRSHFLLKVIPYHHTLFEHLITHTVFIINAGIVKT